MGRTYPTHYKRRGVFLKELGAKTSAEAGIDTPNEISKNGAGVNFMAYHS